MNIRNPVSAEVTALLVLTGLTFVALFLFLPSELVAPLLVVAFVGFLYFGITIALARYNHRIPDWLNTAPLWLIVAGPVAVGIVLLFWFWAEVTVSAAIFVLGMLFLFLYYWILVPFAVVQKTEQLAWEGRKGPIDWPDITVLIPAYNERGHISATLDSLAGTTYPGQVELMVIDDGSLDGTAEEARTHPDVEAIVIQKENGGKHSALNRGLEEASHDIIVSIDADSWIASDALTKLMEGFARHPDAGAIAGNVKVGNRGTFITNLQALEYILGINTFRRAFDHVGLVSVVPGCLGAFRKKTLEEIEGYSPDTLTEDFDLTIEVLKRGEKVHMSEGIVYTYAPTTWRGLYNQRLRWFRGNVQTLIKHADIFANTDYGLLHRLVFPYAFLSMSILPLLGIVVIAIVPVAIYVGQGWLLLRIGVFFLLLLVMLSLLAVEIDDEDRRLVLLAPFSIIGYKQFLDIVLLKSIFDVLTRREMSWTHADRIEGSETDYTESGNE